MTGISTAQLGSTERVLAAFRRAVSESSAYRTLLAQHGVPVDAVSDLETFVRVCPALNKDNTFGRFPVHELVRTGVLDQVSDVLTSSGHGGRFSFGIGTRRQAAVAAAVADDALDAAFQVKSRKTLTINCLPMGVGVSSGCMTVATVSVREDMAVALIKRFGRYFDQVLVISDPLFIPCLLAHAAAVGLDWTRYAVKVIIGEEFFGECFRSYVGARLGYSPRDLNDGVIRSSFGIGELGLHLFYETPTTIALRRHAVTDPAFATELWGAVMLTSPAPILFAFDDTRTFIEVDHPDAAGFGELTVTMLDPQLPVPLLRYQPGDVVALLDDREVSAAARRHGLELTDVPRHLVALRGRRDEFVPNGCHVGVYREALFANLEVASVLTGAMRVEAETDAITLHVQMMSGCSRSPTMAASIANAVAPEHRPVHVRLWPYEKFPFGMRLDYERKFRYCDPTVRPRPS
jgi:phenylacetate-CoA ligase